MYSVLPSALALVDYIREFINGSHLEDDCLALLADIDTLLFTDENFLVST